MKRIYFIFIALICFLTASAQEKLGIANSNYSSTNSIYLNPASSVDCRTLMQLNLVGLNIYMMNNQAYLPKFNVWDASKGDMQDPKIKTTGFKKFLDVKAEVNAPTFILSNKEIGIGFFIRGRAEASIKNIPAELAQLLVQTKIDTSSQFNIDLKNTRVSEMSWVEYGINFGKMYFKHGKKLIAWGGNLKYLTGINLAYGNIFRLNANVSDTQFDVQNLRAKVRYNQPGWNAGRGVGLDIGITYKKMLNYVDTYFSNSQKSNCKYIDYKYKVGVSLLDLGAIRFTNKTFKGDISGSTTINDYKHTNIDSIIRADFNLTQQLNEPILASLPTAISLQGDLNLGHHFYVNGTWIQGITAARIIGVQKAALISVAPRFETRNIEIAVPVTFHRYIYPQVGAAIRFRTLVIGMDNILPFIAHTNTYGANFYFNLGISIFKNPKCKKSSPRYNPPKIKYEGYTFLSGRNKKKSVSANGQGQAPERTNGRKGRKSSGKKGKKKGVFKKRSQKL
ncbi:MAG: DUF5723 family protein [Bacteroidota bacterium]